MEFLPTSYVLSLVMLCVLLFNSWPCTCNFTSFIFGDSLVDSGNNNYLLTLSKADYSPYGIDFKPSGHNPTGRFTNGRTTSDIIGQVLGAQSFPRPYLSPNALSYCVSEGINYASGSSGILDETGNLFRLHSKGARKILVLGVGPLGCIPFVRALQVVLREKCSLSVNDFSQGYNKKLADLIDRLNQQLGPQTIFVYANAYDIVMGIIQNYRQYGFENVDDPCCWGYFPPYTCFNIESNSNASSAICDYRSKYVFWDAYHPTEATNLIIAHKLLNVDQSVITPISVRHLYSYTF